MNLRKTAILLTLSNVLPMASFAHDIVKDIENITKTEAISSYIAIGFQHILPLGFDHILFIISLVLLNNSKKQLLWQSAAFTIGHCITLALVSLNFITISPNIVEPIIAATIVFTALSVLKKQELNSIKIFIVLLFGLIHGLGFAGALAEIGLPANQFILSLISFNLGLELGQITIILISIFLIKLAEMKLHWPLRTISIPISIFIMAIGVFWFFERI